MSRTKCLRYPYPGIQRVISVILLLAITPLANAQNLSLPDAIKKALDNYPLILQKKAELNADAAHIRTVASRKLPSFILSEQIDAGTANSMIGPYFSMGIVPSTSGAVAASENANTASANIATALMQLDVYRFGYHNAERKEAEAAFATSDARLKSQEFILASNITSLYFDWLKKYRLMLVLEQNRVRANTIFTSIRANVLSGLKPGVDSSTAMAESSRAYISYLQALTAYENDRAELAGYTGLDTGSIKPDTSVVSSAKMARILEIAPVTVVPASHPLIEAARRELEQQQVSNTIIAKKYLPNFSVQGATWMRGSSIAYNDMYNSLNDGLAYSRYNYLVGVAATYNLTDLKQRHDQLAEGRYRAEAKKMSLETRQTDLDIALQQATISYTNTLRQLRELPTLLQSANAAYTQQLTLYKAGLNTLVDVTNALYNLQKAETDNILAQSELLQIQYLRASLSDKQDSFFENFK